MGFIIAIVIGFFAGIIFCAIVCALKLQEMFMRMSCMCDDCVKWKEE